MDIRLYQEDYWCHKDLLVEVHLFDRQKIIVRYHLQVHCIQSRSNVELVISVEFYINIFIV